MVVSTVGRFATNYTRLAAWFVGVYLACTILMESSFVALLTRYGDPALFWHIGKEWRHGKIPYQEVWDSKPPGIFLINAIADAVSPESFWGLAAIVALFSFGSVVGVYMLCRASRAPRDVCALAAVGLGVFSNLRAFHGGNMTESYLIWPATMSMYCFKIAGEGLYSTRILLAGFFCGIATLFKPVGMAPLLAQCAFLSLAVVKGNLTISKSLKHVSLLAAGFLGAWAPFVVYFRVHHTLAAMLDASLIYNLRYGLASQPNPFKAVVLLTSEVAPVGSLVVAAGLGVGFWLYLCCRSNKPDSNPAGDVCPPKDLWTLVLLWMLFDLAGILAGGRALVHYFISIAPSLSAAAAMTYWYLSRLTMQPKFPFKATFAVLIVGPLLFVQAGDAIQLVTAAPDPALAATPAQKARLERWRMASDYMKTIQKPTDTLFTWDYLPWIYYQTQLSNGIKYPSAHYILDSPWAHEKVGREILQQLQENRPTFIIDDGDNSMGGVPKTLTRDAYYLQFVAFLKEHYDRVYSVQRLSVYRISK